jgi:hypothetical protein
MRGRERSRVSEMEKKLGHTHFTPWVVSECRCSLRTAELAMSVAEYVGDDDGRGEKISLLPRALQYLIAAPSTPQHVRDHVLDCYDKGKRLKIKHVKQILRAATGKPNQPARETRKQAETPATAHQQATSPAGDQGNESKGDPTAYETVDPASHSAPTNCAPPNKQAKQAPAPEPEAPMASPAMSPEQSPESDPATDHPLMESANNISAIDDARSGYLQRITEILGTQVTAKGLLIQLLHKIGYDDLAGRLQAYDGQQRRAAA